MKAIVRINNTNELVEVINEYEAEDIEFKYLEGSKKGQIDMTDVDNIVRYVKDRKPRQVSHFKEVEFTKCHDHFFGEIRTFWRADYNNQTIAIADTKKECIAQARAELARI